MQKLLLCEEQYDSMCVYPLGLLTLPGHMHLNAFMALSRRDCCFSCPAKWPNTGFRVGPFRFNYLVIETLGNIFFTLSQSCNFQCQSAIVEIKQNTAASSKVMFSKRSQNSTHYGRSSMQVIHNYIEECYESRTVLNKRQTQTDKHTLDTVQTDIPWIPWIQYHILKDNHIRVNTQL
jgi:hypothetical protein